MANVKLSTLAYRNPDGTYTPIVTSAKENEIFKKVLTSGTTQVTITSPKITTDSVLSFYTSIYGVSPTEVSVANGSVTLTFDAQESDMEVGVRIDG